MTTLLHFSKRSGSQIVGLLLMLAFTAGAENLFLRSNASGAANGSDWNNAWVDFGQVQWGSGAGQLGPGDTLWIAGGSYSTITPGGNGSAGSTATTWIKIWRATTSDAAATSAAGWSASYDSLVTFGGVNMSSPHIGEYVWYSGRRNTTGVNPGMKVNVGVGGSAINWPTFSVNNVIFDCIEVAGPAPHPQTSAYNFGTGNSTRGFDMTAWNGSWQQITNIWITNNWVHGCVDLTYPVNCRWVHIDHNVLCDNWTMPDPEPQHENVCITLDCEDMSFSYNSISNWAVEGIEMGYSHANWEIVGNIWKKMSAGPYARALETQYQPSTGIKVYNNTFIDVWLTIYDDGSGGGWSASEIKNNIFINSPVGNIGGGFTTDYNAYDGSTSETHGVANITTAVFNDFAGRDYTLKTNIGTGYLRNKGVDLGATYSLDSRGVTRGEDGAWDIGALEAVTGEVLPADTNAPTITSGDASGSVSATFSYSITASGAVTSWGATNLPAGLSRSAELIYGIPTAAGVTSVGLFATNAYGFTNKVVTFTIAAAQPAITMYPSTITFADAPTQTVQYALVIISNSVPDTILTGYPTNAVSPFAIHSSGGYTLSNTQTRAVVLKYTPTVRGVHSGSVAFTGTATQATNTLFGRAFPVMPSTNWTAVNSLIISPMVTNVANYVSQSSSSEEPTVGGSVIVGYTAPSAGTVRLFCSTIASNDAQNSFFVNVGSFDPAVTYATNVWDVTNYTTAFQFQYVAKRGSGTFDNPQFPTNDFPVNSGLNEIVIRGRESNVKLREINVEFTSGAADTVAPVISNVQVITNADTATITWTTSEASPSGVDYGATAGYGMNETNIVFTTSHSISLIELSEATVYHFNIYAGDAAGNTTNNSDLVFTTGSTPVSDTTPPVISGVTVSSTNPTSATVTWTTDETSLGWAEHGTTTNYGTASATNTYSTSHSRTLRSLAESTVYHFRVGAADAAGNSTNSSDYAFATPASEPPTISSVTVATNQTVVVVTFSGGESVRSGVVYGLTDSYGSTATNGTDYALSPSVTISGLTPNTVYHYRPYATDTGGQTASNSVDSVFTTLAAPSPGTVYRATATRVTITGP